MNIPMDNDLIPKWPIVEQAHTVGIVNAMDRPWICVGERDGKRIGAQCRCHSKRCHSRPVTLSQEEFLVYGQKTPVFVGQCKNCGFIYWAVVQ
jgi:hypothetical protein